MQAGVLTEGEDFTRSGGTYTFGAGWVGKQLEIQYQVTDPGTFQSALQQLGLGLANGTIGQATWSYLTTNHSPQAIGYSGLAYVRASSYELTSSAQVENHSFEVSTPSEFSSTIVDANMAVVVKEFLTDGVRGAQWPASKLAALTAYSNYCIAYGLFMSPALIEQEAAADILARWLKFTNADIVWSGTSLKVVPLGDENKTANGATYTADTTPRYDLTENDFVREGDEPRVQVIPRVNEDVVNHVRVEFLNRDNDYAAEIMPAKDLAHIEQFGERVGEVIKAHEVKTPEVAQFVAQMELQRQTAVLNDYRFSLPWTKGRLEPRDLLTLTDPEVDLLRVPVSITRVTEAENGRFDIEAEDAPIGKASAPAYGVQAGTGFKQDWGVAPGSVSTPVFFEAPVELTTTGLEVWCAVRGAGQYWGGCSVWVSMDGLSYKKVDTIHGGARYGTITGPVSGGELPVQLLGGQLLAGTAADAAALATLCYVGGSAPEYLAYSDAALTGTSAYTLSGLQRSAYGTSQSAHAGGDLFVRVDDAIAKSGPLDLDFIGKTLYMKFTSFNLFGTAEESVADVSAYQYLVTGVMAQLPPSQPLGLGYTVQPFGVRLYCAKNAEPDVVAYQWRLGADWDTAQVLEAAGGTSHALTVQTTGTLTAWVAAVDRLGNFSTPASLPVTVAAPTMASVSASFAGAELVLTYQGTPGAFALGGYEIRHGDVFASAQVVTFQQVTRWAKTVDWGGARRWWVVPVDVKGNYGTEASADTNVAAPGAVTASRAEVVDNNVLLYWAQPTTGTLPVDRYEVRKGASWVAGTSVGSNGNSTFAAVFEQLGGSYTYWVAAYDSAGNEGTAVPINATVNQPPDYLLRVDYNDDFAGTCSGCYVEDGKVYGPSLGETIQQHFEGRGWATINDQITAGYPLVFEPSGTSCYYERVLDYGTTLPSTTVTVTPTLNTLAGSVTSALQISYKAASADPWIDAPAGQAQILASGFRYVKVRVTWTASGGDDLGELAQLNIKLASKLKTDSGSGTAAAGDAGGTSVSFNVAFIDVTSINVTASGTVARYALYDFVDAPNPTGFKVLLFDNNGNRVSGAFSWTARGY